MEKLITSLAHVALKCNGKAQHDKAIKFYTEVLGLKILRTWGENDNTATMIDTGNGIIEIFSDAKEDLDYGIIYHLALATNDVDECIKRVKQAGFEVIKEPTDITIPSNPPYPVRIAFCKGAVNEEIEFFMQR